MNGFTTTITQCGFDYNDNLKNAAWIVKMVTMK